MLVEDFWRFDNGFEQLAIDGHDGAEISHEPGGGYSLDVWLTDRSDAPNAPPTEERWRTLWSYQARQGQFALGDPMGGSVWYSETHGGGIPAGSLLVALRPPADSDTGVGMWALIAAVENHTTLPSALFELTIELVCLAPLPDYPDHAAVRRALEREGIGF